MDNNTENTVRTLLSLLLIWIYVYRLMGKKARRLYYVRGRRMDYTSSSSGCVAVRVRDCACRLISICTVAARTVAAHLSQVAKLALPGQTDHNHTGRFEHG